MSQAGGQVPQGAAGAGQPRPNPQLQILRPENVRGLQHFNAEEKSEHEAALKRLWDAIPPVGTQVTAAGKEQQMKVVQYSKMLLKMNQDRKIEYNQNQKAQAAQQLARVQAAQAGNAQGGGPSQGSAPRQMTDAQGAAGVGSGPGVGTGAGAGAGQPTQIKLPAHIQQHLNQMTYFPLPNLADKSPEGIRKWQTATREKLAKALMHMEQTRGQMTKIEEQVNERNQKGNPLNEQEQRTLAERRTTLLKSHGDASEFVKRFREQQETIKAQREQARLQAQAQAQANGGNAGAAAANLNSKPRPQPGQIATAGAAAAGNSSSPNSGMQASPNAAAAQVNAAFEAAKNAAARTQAQNKALSAQQQAGQAGGIHAPPAPHLGVGVGIGGQPGQNLQQGQPQPAIKMEPGSRGPPHPAPINTQLAASGLPAPGTPNQGPGRMQTPQSAVPQSFRPLSHANAMSMANARQSQPNSAAPGQSATGGTPASAAGFPGVNPQQIHAPHPGQTPPGQTIQSKMPIQKNLPEKTMGTPVPVSLGGGVNPGRPTLSGGGGVAGGVMGQPVITRTPGFSLESEGERVLNKKKLDELVRQICGGAAEGHEGGLLAPEVEESVLNLADTFVDTVLHQACRNAKERGSKVLEIRDIQLVLERVYNIRIPGYSSDELRTIRKIQPSAAWINKMSAVQAAKVMPGKGDT